MPNCFQLLNCETGKADSFVEIDERMCADLGWPVDEDCYTHEWYDVLGLGMALGKSLDELRVIFADDGDLTLIVNWLAERYTVSAWYESRR